MLRAAGGASARAARRVRAAPRTSVHDAQLAVLVATGDSVVQVVVHNSGSEHLQKHPDALGVLRGTWGQGWLPVGKGMLLHRAQHVSIFMHCELHDQAFLWLHGGRHGDHARPEVPQELGVGRRRHILPHCQNVAPGGVRRDRVWPHELCAAVLSFLDPIERDERLA